nr:NAD-dependent epimerase/dehydratase family protein [uncultured Flavobacterium sp.]
MVEKILITGASGFVGNNIISYLDTLMSVEILSCRYKLNQSFDFDVFAMIHLSGKAHDLKKVTNPSEYYEANYELTKQLFDAFLVSNTKVFIFMSTVKAVADEVNDILKEDEIPNPKTHYGISKQKAEQYILSKKLPKDKRVYILRPCMIHGSGNKGNLNLLYQLVVKGLPWPLGAFENKRSFLSIENLCFVIKELLQNETISAGIYNVADDDALSTNELIGLLSKSLGKCNKILKISAFLVKKMASLGDIFKLPLNSERLQKLTENYVVSNTKIKAAIGKEFPISAKEGLLITFDSFKNNT